MRSLSVHKENNGYLVIRALLICFLFLASALAIAVAVVDQFSEDTDAAFDRASKYSFRDGDTLYIKPYDIGDYKEPGVEYIGGGPMSDYFPRNYDRYSELYTYYRPAWEDTGGRYFDKITKVVIAEGITSLGTCTFMDVTHIESVELPTTLKVIRSDAFNGCIKLKSINLENVERIEHDAFRGCSSLEMAVLGDNLTYVGDNAFYGCSSLKEVFFLGDDCNFSVGKDAFCLNPIHPPSTSYYVMSYGNVATGKFGNPGPNQSFLYLSSTGFEKKIGWEIRGDTLLLSKNTGDKTVFMDEYGFSINGEARPGWESNDAYRWVTKVVIGPGIGNVSSCAFYDKTNLTSVVLSDTVGSIGDRSFENCVELESITLSDKLHRIGQYAFSNCSSLMEINLPSTIEYINDCAFSECSGLTSVTFDCPESYYTISQGLFSGCLSLRSFEIPECVYRIEDNAFSRCNSLESLVIPGSVGVIGAYVFLNSGLKDIEYTGTTWNIEDCDKNAFSLRSFGLSSKVVCLVGSPNNLALGNLDKVSNNTQVVWEFRATSGTDGNIDWRISGDTLTLSKNVAADSGFMGVYDGTSRPEWESGYKWCDVTKIVIENGVASIGDYAFNGLSSLESVEILGSLVRFGDYAFNGCSALGSIYLPQTVSYIGLHAFSGCESLSAITIPPAVTEICPYTFENCNSIETVGIPASVTKIGEGAFKACESLTAVTIPPAVTEIYEKAFEGCSSMEEVFFESDKWIISYLGNRSFLTKPDTVLHVYSPDNVADRKLERPNGNQLLFKYQSSAGTGKDVVWAINGDTITFSNPQGSNGIMRPYSQTVRPSWEETRLWNNVTKVVIGTGITSIGEWTFYKCSNISTVEIADTVTNIGDAAFCKCTSLAEVRIPSSVTAVGIISFNGCTSLKVLDLSSADSLTLIGEGAFQNCGSFKSLTIPQSVRKIGYDAFNGCFGLKEIWFAGKQWSTQIDSGAFALGTTEKSAQCEVYSSFNFANGKLDPCINDSTAIIYSGIEGVEGNIYWIIENGTLTMSKAESATGGSMNDYSHENIPAWIRTGAWKYVTHIYIGGGITDIGDYAFSSRDLNKSIDTVLMSAPVSTIGDYAFSGCTMLTTVGFPSTLTEIGEGAFAMSMYLKHLEIPYTVENVSIGDMAFAFSGITSLTLPESVTYIGKKAFTLCASLQEMTLPATAVYDESAFGLIAAEKIYFIGDEWGATIGENAFIGSKGHTVTVYSENNIADGKFDRDGVTFEYLPLIHPETITHKWVNIDGTVLKVEENMPYDGEPTYDGPLPFILEGWTFSGWSEVKYGNGDWNYVAMYQYGDLDNLGGDSEDSEPAEGSFMDNVVDFLKNIVRTVKEWVSILFRNLIYPFAYI